MSSGTLRGLSIAIGATAMLAIGGAALLVIVYGSFEALFLLLPLGGAAVAIILAGAQASRHPLTVPDPFARELSQFDVINIAHVRVAGVGGLGLIVVAATVVLEFELLTAAYAAGILGGLCCAAALVVYRRMAGYKDAVSAFRRTE
jgi:hypothetical protein